MKENLTDRQRDVYAMFAGYIQDNGYAPTYREAAERLGMTAQMVEAHIKNIVAKGWMAYTVKKQRRVELIPKN